MWFRPSKRQFAIGLLGLILVLGTTACAEDEPGEAAEGVEDVSFTISVADPIDSSVGQAAQYFADELDEASGGAIDANVQPDGVLFDGDQEAAIDMVGTGALDVLILSTSVYQTVEPRMNAVSLPYLFEDVEQLHDYLTAEPGDELLESLEGHNTRGLAMMIRTPRHVTNSVGPIEEPADMQGLSLRTPNNPLWLEFFGAVGASPTPMDFAEVYTAMQLGTIDGQENPVEVPQANAFYEVQDYLSLTGHMSDGYILAMNADTFDGLSPETQEVIVEAAESTSEWKLEFDIEDEERILGELEEQGMQVNELSEEGREEFQEIARDLYDALEDEIGADFMQTTLEYVGHE